MRLEIHVRPNASNTAVGGNYDGALVVRVRQPAEGGKATAAALKAVAAALGIPPKSLTLVTGATSRRKLVDIRALSSQHQLLEKRVRDLLGQAGD